MHRALASKGSDFEKAKEAAYNYLSYRGRSVFEVRNKLKDKGYDNKTVDLVVERLIELNLLNDEDFALTLTKEFVEKRGCGRFLVEKKLREKGIAPETLHSVIGPFFSDADDVERAKMMALKRMRKPLSDRKEKERIGRYLERKGYSWGIIMEALKGIDDRERDQE